MSILKRLCETTTSDSLFIFYHHNYAMRHALCAMRLRGREENDNAGFFEEQQVVRSTF